MTVSVSSTSPLALHPLAELNGRTKLLPGMSYKLAEGYGLDVAFTDSLDIDEKKMAVWVPYADGNRRDGVGDLLVVEGIDESRHRKNPIHLFDHGKSVTLPVGKVEDPETGRYTGIIDPVTKCAKDLVYYYRGTGLPGVDKSAEYDHALFCQQVFHLLAQKFIRGGSIGYQVLQARELPPEPMYGTPKGLLLISVLKLESSTVVMPANADTVRKGLAPDLREVLAMPRVCGKPLSPMLVKSLTAYAPEKKAQLGYEGKALPRAKVTLSNGMGTVEVDSGSPSNPWRMSLARYDIREGTRVIEEAMRRQQWPDDVITSALEELRRSGVKAAPPASPDAATVHTRQPAPPPQSPNQGAMGVREQADGWYVYDPKTGQNQFGPFFSSGIALRWAERLNMGKKNVKELRKKYRRTAKGLVRRLKRSSPGSSVIYMTGKDLEKARKEAEAKGIKFTHVSSRNGMARVKLIGDDGAIDEVAKSYGRLVKFQGAKSLKAQPLREPQQSNVHAGVAEAGEEVVARRAIMDASGREYFAKPGDRLMVVGTDAGQMKVRNRAGVEKLVISNDVRRKSMKAGTNAGGQIPLWKWNRRTGYWERQRECLPENAQQYLEIFRRDEPNEFFVLSNTKPNKDPRDNPQMMKSLKAQPLREPQRTNVHAGTEEYGETVVARRAIMQTQNVYEYFAQPGETLTVVGRNDVGQMRVRNRAGVEQSVTSIDVRRKAMGVKSISKSGRVKVDGSWYDYEGREVHGNIQYSFDYGTTWASTKKESFEKAKASGTLKPSMRQNSLTSAQGSKSMRHTKKKDGEEMSVGDESTTASGEERQLPLGAQVLRRLHEDASLLLQDYDEMLGPLENENVKTRLQGKLEGFTEELTELEEEFGKLYPDLGGLVGTKEGELEEAADLESDGEADNDKEEYEEELEATPKDMDTMDDAAVGSSSEEREEVSPEDALEGMEAAEEEEKMDEKHLRRKVKSLRRKYGKKGMCPECGKEDCECGETDEKGQKIAPALVAAAAPAVGQLVGGALTPKDKGYVKEAGGFLGDMGQPDSILDDEGRMKSYHYHKTLEGMAQLDEARDDLEEDREDLQDSGIPPAEFEPGAGAKTHRGGYASAYRRAPAGAHDPRGPRRGTGYSAPSPKPKEPPKPPTPESKAADERQRTDTDSDGAVRGERNEITRHVANPAPDPKPGQSTTMQYKGQMDILAGAADFLKELAFLPELDDDYRGRSTEFSKGLNDFVGPDEDAPMEDDNEIPDGDPNEELPPDEGGSSGAPSGPPEGVVMEEEVPEEEPGMEMKFLAEEATLQNKKIAELSRMLSRLPI